MRTVSGLTPQSHIPPPQPIRTQWAEPVQAQVRTGDSAASAKHQKPGCFGISFLWFSFTSDFLRHFSLSLSSFSFFSSFRDFFFFFFLRSRWRSSGERESLRSDQSGQHQNHRERMATGRAGRLWTWRTRTSLTSPSSSSSSCSLCRYSVLGCAGVCCVREETLTSWTDA